MNEVVYKPMNMNDGVIVCSIRIVSYLIKV